MTVGSRAQKGALPGSGEGLIAGSLALASYLPLGGDGFVEGDGITPIGERALGLIKHLPPPRSPRRSAAAPLPGCLTVPPPHCEPASTSFDVLPAHHLTAPVLDCPTAHITSTTR